MHIVNSCTNDIQHTDIESITDAYSQVVLMIYSILKTTKSVKSANSHLNRFLSASAWSSHFSDNFCRKHCLLTSILMCCSSHLHGKQFTNILNKTTYFHMHISISEIFIPLCCRYQVVLSCTCKEYSKDMQFLATSLYYNPTTCTSCESVRNI